MTSTATKRAMIPTSNKQQKSKSIKKGAKIAVNIQKKCLLGKYE